MRNFISQKIKWLSRQSNTDLIAIGWSSFWWVFGKVWVGILAFASLVAFSHLLSRESYGTYQYILSCLAIPSMFTLYGIDTSIIKSISQGFDGTLARALREKITWGLMASFIILGFSAWYFVHGDLMLAAAFGVGAFFAPIRESFAIFWAFWNGKNNFSKQAQFAITSAFFNTVCVIVVLVSTRNILATLVAFLASKTLADFVLYRITTRSVQNAVVDYEALSFGKHLTAMESVEVLSLYLDKIIIWNMLGPTAVAVFSFAQTPLRKAVDLMPVVPVALARLGAYDIREIKSAVFKKFLVLFAIMIPTAAVIAICAPMLFAAAFPQYLDSVPYFQALCVLIAFVPFSFLATALVVALKRRDLYIIRIGSPVLKIVLFFALMPSFGIWGIVAGVLIAELAKGLATVYFFNEV